MDQPDQWKRSSFRAYSCGERGLVRVNFHEWPLELKRRAVERLETGVVRVAHSFAKRANEWGTLRDCLGHPPHLPIVPSELSVRNDTPYDDGCLDQE